MEIVYKSMDSLNKLVLRNLVLKQEYMFKIRVWFEVKLQGAQENHEAEVSADTMGTRVLGQEGGEDNVAGRKKRRSKEAKLKNLLKYKT
ncbi:hypothetical protein Tco_1065976 [Tanacetum coccineum]